MTLPASLRLGAEPCTYVADSAVHRMLTRDPAGYVNHLEVSLDQVAAGRWKIEMPPKTIFEDESGGGDFRVMPCVVDALKTVKVIGTNRRRWTVGQITVGKLLVLDEIENFVTHIFDACLLSSARTAAVAALAMRRLQPWRERVAIVGAGRIGYYAALYAAADGEAIEILVCDRVPGRAAATADDLRRVLGQVKVSSCDYDKIDRTDVLVLATDSTEPVYHPRDFAADLVISVGADTDAQSELDELCSQLQVFVDHPHSARCGDLQRWLRAGNLHAREVQSLLEGVTVDTGRPKVFISTGSALFDNMTVAYYLGGNRVAGQIPAV